MRRILATPALIVALSLSSLAAAKDQQPTEPLPDWNRYIALAEPAVRAKLAEPDHWAISWPYGYAFGTWHHHGKFDGYLTCGVVRAISPIKGGYPSFNFAAVVYHDQIQTIDIDTRVTNSKVNLLCGVINKRGMLPPASLMPGANDHTIARLGIIVRAVPEGALIAAVTADMPAARAGLVEGTVITQANGVKLAGLGDAIPAILQSGTDPLVLTSASGTTFRIGSHAQ